jgi:hypothetical protein
MPFPLCCRVAPMGALSGLRLDPLWGAERDGFLTQTNRTVFRQVTGIFLVDRDQVTQGFG